MLDLVPKIKSIKMLDFHETWYEGHVSFSFNNTNMVDLRSCEVETTLSLFIPDRTGRFWVFHSDQSGWDVKLTTLLPLVSRLRIRGGIPPLPYTSARCDA
jgi:hypothetical protein